jgi:3-deoxy-D-manno-octulosonic-acid transferase
MWPILYSSLILPLLMVTIRLAARKNQKIRDTLAGHEGLWDRIEVQIAQRDPQKKLVWFHVASAGEYLQAMPVAHRLMLDGFQCAITVTSVSGYRWAQKRRDAFPDLIMVDYLPWDTRANMRRMLDTIAPDALVFVKFDLWPNLIWQAQKADVPQFMISATLHEKSQRYTSAVARSLYGNLYNAFAGIFAVSEEDKQRFMRTSPRHQDIHNVGDTRFDSVLDRRDAIQPPALPEPLRQSTNILLGSVWPEDEQRIYPVLLDALQKYPGVSCIVAPHEIDEAHLASIEKTFSAFKPIRFTNMAPTHAEPIRVLIVDTVGHLSALYHYAALAYVGGAFGKGVHNTMEPSAMGVPAIFGPFYQNSPEAMELVERKLAFSITSGDDFAGILAKMLDNDAFRRDAGKNAAAFIESQAGASDECFKLIKEAVA